MRRPLEIATCATAAAVIGAAMSATAAPSWLVVCAFGFMLVLAENFDVKVHGGAVAVTPGFMIIMASIAVLGDKPSTVAGASLLAACGGLHFPHFKSKYIGIVAFNCGQYALAGAAAAMVYTAVTAPGGVMQFVAAMLATAAFGAVNVSLIVPYVADRHDERIAVVWADMYPALPNYLAWGMLGLLVGLVCAELGALAIILLAVPWASAGGRSAPSDGCASHRTPRSDCSSASSRPRTRTPPATRNGPPRSRSPSPRR